MRNVKLLGLILLGLFIITAFVMERRSNVLLRTKVATLRGQSNQVNQPAEVARLRSENEHLAEELANLKLQAERAAVERRELLQLRGQMVALRKAAEEGAAAKAALEAQQVRLRAISFVGNTTFSAAQLANLVSSKIGEPMDQQKLSRDAFAIYEAYRQAGHGIIKIDPIRDRDGVTFVIGEPNQDAGIGAQMAYVRPMGALHIDRVIPNSPAEAAGLHRGLYIQEIDGKATQDLTYGQCIGLLRGPTGSQVRLGIWDAERQAHMTIEVRRDKLVL